MKQYEQQHHNKTSAYTEQLCNSSNRSITLNKQQEKKHNYIGSAQSPKILNVNINTNHRDRNDKNNNSMKTRYERLIKLLDRLTYN